MPKKNFSLTIVTTGLIFMLMPLLSFAAQNQITFSLAWSAGTLIPGDYQGKPMPIQGSKITIEAIPSEKISLAKYRFTWYVDNNLQANSSGLGRSSFSFTVSKDPGSSHRVVLQVQDEKNNFFTKTIYIPVGRPEVVLYDKINNLFFDNAIDTNPGKDILFKAIPYFFNTNSSKNLEFSWTMDGKDASTNTDTKNPNLFNLKIGSGSLNQTISYNLELLIRKYQNTGEQTKKSITIFIQNLNANNKE